MNLTVEWPWKGRPEWLRGWGSGDTCSLSDSDGGAFSRGWGGGTTRVGVDRVLLGGFSSISFF